MKTVPFKEELEQIEFAKRAARSFADNPDMASYSDHPPTPGCYIALRWNWDNDGVLVMKLDEYHTPTNYQQMVSQISCEIPVVEVR